MIMVISPPLPKPQKGSAAMPIRAFVPTNVDNELVMTVP